MSRVSSTGSSSSSRSAPITWCTRVQLRAGAGVHPAGLRGPSGRSPGDGRRTSGCRCRTAGPPAARCGRCGGSPPGCRVSGSSSAKSSAASSSGMMPGRTPGRLVTPTGGIGIAHHGRRPCPRPPGPRPGPGRCRWRPGRGSRGAPPRCDSASPMACIRSAGGTSSSRHRRRIFSCSLRNSPWRARSSSTSSSSRPRSTDSSYSKRSSRRLAQAQGARRLALQEARGLLQALEAGLALVLVPHDRPEHAGHRVVLVQLDLVDGDEAHARVLDLGLQELGQHLAQVLVQPAGAIRIHALPVRGSAPSTKPPRGRRPFVSRGDKISPSPPTVNRQASRRRHGRCRRVRARRCRRRIPPSAGPGSGRLEAPRSHGWRRGAGSRAGREQEVPGRRPRLRRRRRRAIRSTARCA